MTSAGVAYDILSLLVNTGYLGRADRRRGGHSLRDLSFTTCPVWAVIDSGTLRVSQA